MELYRAQASALASKRSQMERELAMSMMLNSNDLAFRRGSVATFHGLRKEPLYGSSFFGLPEANSAQAMRLEQELFHRELAALSAWRAGTLLQRAPKASQHPSSLYSLLVGKLNSFGSSTDASSKTSTNAGVSPESCSYTAEAFLKRSGAAMLAGGGCRDSTLKEAALAMTGETGPNKKPRLGSPPGYKSDTSSGSRSLNGGSKVVAQHRRESKTKLRDDFWGKVGKNNSHIHLVNIVIGRLLYKQISNAKFGNRVLSNDLIQQILDEKLYGKYQIRDFFASSSRGSETVRNTWTRLNFSSEDFHKGLSRYKEQTWQAIERCTFEDPSAEDKAEMEAALKVFEETGQFVKALNLALKGIITDPFMGVLMRLRLEWNDICLSCPTEEHDGIVMGFLRKYGLAGK